MMGTEADQVLNEWLKGRPLLKFSLYTATQVETLKAFGKELLGEKRGLPSVADAPTVSTRQTDLRILTQ